MAFLLDRNVITLAIRASSKRKKTFINEPTKNLDAMSYFRTCNNDYSSGDTGICLFFVQITYVVVYH